MDDKQANNAAIEAANPENPFKELEPIGSTPVAPAHGIAALALNMAMKYHDITMIKDGALYQQYKLEGRNFRELHLDVVFETAIKIEMHLLGASERIAKVVVDAITFAVDEDSDGQSVSEAASAPDQTGGDVS